MQNEILETFRTCVTYGQTLPDGREIDIVIRNGDLALVVLDGDEHSIVQQIEYHGIVYVPPPTDERLLTAMRLPTDISEYGNVANLVTEIMPFWSKYLRVTELSALSTTAWVLATCVPELFSAPPALHVVGSSMGRAARFFQLLGAFARRAIMVPDLSFRLPMDWRPSLLVLDSTGSKRSHALWRAGNYRGVYVPGPGGKLHELACSKAIYTGTEDVVSSWDEESFRVVLLPSNEALSLADPDLNALASEFQPKLQLFRMRTLKKRARGAAAVCPPDLAVSPLSRELFAVLGTEPETAELLLPIAEQQRSVMSARRSLDPTAAVIEVIWGPAHRRALITTTDVQKRVNALLGVRGESLEFSVKEIGWKLRDLGLPRDRRADGMILRFSRDLRLQIHDLARRFGLTLPEVDGCAECAPAAMAETSGSVIREVSKGDSCGGSSGLR